MNFRFPQAPATPMETIVNTIGKDGMKLMMDMMMWNPEKRPSASQSLKYKYFQVNEKLGAPVMSQPAPGSVRKTSAGSTQSDTKAICAKQKAVAKEYPGSENVSPQGKPIERHLNRNIPLNKSNLFDKLDESTTKLEKIDAAKNKSSEKKPAKEIYLSKSRFIPGLLYPFLEGKALCQKKEEAITRWRLEETRRVPRIVQQYRRAPLRYVQYYNVVDSIAAIHFYITFAECAISKDPKTKLKRKLRAEVG
ncbi:hypothetical protein ANCCEY_14259 [Ancylostoma ceylanicum]|uniref:Protein kinase domain-containing protein n=1 Tax=Ancylostoma ceylanicum TaxID=53326 RepID=A0A0D6L6X8_9BILA|nr:hypothetical protein ANCCEY_14259 [Ancylostoma ceylanicum]